MDLKGKKIEDLTLQEMFKVVMEQYKEVAGKPAAETTSLFKDWANIKKEIIEKIAINSGLDFENTYLKDYNNGRITFGSGKFTNVFVISVRNISNPSRKAGVYIAYLFNKDEASCYLTLSQAAQEFSAKETKKRVKELQDLLDLDEFDIKGAQTGNDRYNRGIITYKKYTLDDLPSDIVLYEDLRKIEKIYSQYLTLDVDNILFSNVSKTIDIQLSKILEKMILDGEKCNRKTAAIAVFGINYGQYLTAMMPERRYAILKKCAPSSNTAQLDNGTAIYNFMKKCEIIDVFKIEEDDSYTKIQLEQFLNEIKEKYKDISAVTEAILKTYAIKYSKSISKLGSNNIFGRKESVNINSGIEIADFITKFPEYKTPMVIKDSDTSSEAMTETDDGVVYNNKYSSKLINSLNIIFRGAPGTGKSYLAKKIAADIVSDGETDKYDDLDDEQKKQIEFVQFHPSYDYSDFVEGLRPVKGTSVSIEFDLKDGVFKKFVNSAKGEPDKKYIFIIDEINRGEISKIFGELFFSIDPGYRGEKGKVSTQYANMHGEGEEKFYIPENVYIIGTMNDIDRSVDTFDFAMRRRFRFIEITAKESQDMLKNSAHKDEIISRMDRVNKVIKEEIEGLDENYQIGAAYFLKVKNDDDLKEVWLEQLKPLLQEYVNGMYDAQKHMEDLENAYFGIKDDNKKEDAEQPEVSDGEDTSDEFSTLN